MPDLFRLSGKVEIDTRNAESALKRTDEMAKRTAKTFGEAGASAQKFSSDLTAFSSKLDATASGLRNVGASAKDFGRSMSVGLTVPLAAFGGAAVKAVTKPHVAQNSGNSEWYTPAEYIKAARVVLLSGRTMKKQSAVMIL